MAHCKPNHLPWFLVPVLTMGLSLYVRTPPSEASAFITHRSRSRISASISKGICRCPRLLVASRAAFSTGKARNQEDSTSQKSKLSVATSFCHSHLLTITRLSRPDMASPPVIPKFSPVEYAALLQWYKHRSDWLQGLCRRSWGSVDRIIPPAFTNRSGGNPGRLDTGARPKQGPTTTAKCTSNIPQTSEAKSGLRHAILWSTASILQRAERRVLCRFRPQGSLLSKPACCWANSSTPDHWAMDGAPE